MRMLSCRTSKAPDTAAPNDAAAGNSDGRHAGTATAAPTAAAGTLNNDGSNLCILHSYAFLSFAFSHSAPALHWLAHTHSLPHTTHKLIG